MINLASFCAYPSGAPTGPPAALGHIEAMLVLPQHLLARHLAHLMHHIRTSASAAPLPMRAGADFIAHSLPSAQGSFGVDMNTLAVAILTSTARQHAHGWAKAGMRVRWQMDTRISSLADVPARRQSFNVCHGIKLKLCLNGWVLDDAPICS